MSLSIRDQIPGAVADVATGGAMAAVKVDVEGGVRSPLRSPRRLWPIWEWPPTLPWSR